MAGFRLSLEAEADLDRHWLYIARASASIETANRIINSISEHFWLLAEPPYMGRSRDEDLRHGLRSFPVGDYLIVYRIDKDGVVLILHIPHGSQDTSSWLGH